MPPTISDADLATVRRRTSASVREMSDAVIDAIYVSASQGNLDLDRTTFYVLRDLLGVLVSLIDVSDPTLPSSAKYSQRFDHIVKTVLPMWSSITGLPIAAGVLITVTATNTYRTDSLQTEEPTYDRGLPSGRYIWDEDV